MAGRDIGRIMARSASDYHDIQAILRSGFGRLEDASFVLLRITNQGEAKAWLGALAERPGIAPLSYRVTRAADLQSHQPVALQVAFTAQGLRNLGVPDELVRSFSREFYLGEVTREAEREGRPRRLGDVGDNAPSAWEWGAPNQIPDVLVMLYAGAGGMAAFKQRVLADLASGFQALRVLDAATAAADGLRREPFGFPDGISQPEVDWDARRTPGTGDDLEYGNSVAAGEFLLGYINEYGFYTQRPLLDPERDPENVLPPADEAPTKRDLGRNGTYLVFRQLEQDVSGFWRFVSAHSPADGGVSLAEAMVGRRLATGDPLVA